MNRGVARVVDLAGPLAVLTQAGGFALDRDGRPPLLRADTRQRYRLAAAHDEPTARRLLAPVEALVDDPR